MLDIAREMVFKGSTHTSAYAARGSGIEDETDRRL